MTPRGHPGARTSLLVLRHVLGDTFSVESDDGGVSLVDSATLKRLLDQQSKGIDHEHQLGGEALG